MKQVVEEKKKKKKEVEEEETELDNRLAYPKTQSKLCDQFKPKKTTQKYRIIINSRILSSVCVCVCV